MKVTVAEHAGFCFGVQRAVEMVYKAAEKKGQQVYTMGPVVHNEQVIEDLEKKGVRIIDDSLLDAVTHEAVEKDAVIIIRAHGISEELHKKLEVSGAKIVDATCPFVGKIHRIVREEYKEGNAIVIVGNPDHPEVQGIRGWVGGPCTVVENASDARNLALPKEKPITIVSQTTFNSSKFLEIVEIIQSLGYHVRVKNTICNATCERQTEALDLAKQSDVMIVIGGRQSSNTQKLFDICRSQCKNTYYIQTQEDLVHVDFQSDSCVGITAGASTPNTIIQEVSQHVRGTKF
ncbi:MAG: 4-hydroxy-3-methylbut-2-enyl diphosphate reductase [Lachnospiraceae bacterium]|nr:4-hydroxy-3-methylbut-2-enyl diphosphate reductase [Lachnospiraceae bacterium]